MQRIRKKINQPLNMIKENKKVVKIKKMNLKKMSWNNNTQFNQKRTKGIKKMIRKKENKKKSRKERKNNNLINKNRSRQKRKVLKAINQMNNKKKSRKVQLIQN